MVDIQNNKLVIGSISAETLVSEFGSPLYVYDEELIKQRYTELFSSILYPKKKLYYACKANSNPAIMKLLCSLGSSVDTVSPHEAALALNVGFLPDRIMFTGVNASLDDFRFCIQHKIMVNCGSLSQIEMYGKLNPNASIFVRINPDVGGGHHGHVITGGPESKFGIYYDKVSEIKATAKKYGLRIVGIHAHIGSGILDPATFKKAMQMVLLTAKQFEGLESVDFGGGLGVVYRPDQTPLPIKEYGKEVSALFSDFCKQYGKELVFILEPGRYIVAESGTLLTTVTSRTATPKHTFVGVDSGFNHLVRAAMYGSYHPIVNASQVEGKKESIVVAGNICESGDVFTRDEHGPLDREITAAKEGDILAIGIAGAYGYAMASTYNLRGRPAEVLVSHGKARLVRRRETFDDLLRTSVF